MTSASFTHSTSTPIADPTEPYAPPAPPSADEQIQAVLDLLKGSAVYIAPHVLGFPDHRVAAIALLATGALQHKEAQFCGNVATNKEPLSRAQSDWLKKLLLREKLPLA